MYRLIFAFFSFLLIGAGSFAQTAGVASSCLATHFFNACDTAGYVTFGFGSTTGAGTGSPDPLTIKHQNMSVGINTSSPLAKLHIRGAGATNATSALLVNNSANSEVFRVLDNGYVGIGTAAPQSALAVNGTITSTKVKVTQSGWPDYVFEPSYKLLSLRELESYIQEHKHLPGIASAEDISNGGVDLGDNQAAVLKKVEELTLYVIQQNKELEQLKELNKQLQLQNARLDKQHREIKKIKKLVAGGVHQ